MVIKHDLKAVSEDIDRIFRREDEINNGNFYKMAMDDLSNGNIDKELWAACQAHCNFDNRKAEGLYVREAAARYRDKYQTHKSMAGSVDGLHDQAARARKHYRQEAIDRARESNANAARKRHDDRQRRIEYARNLNNESYIENENLTHGESWSNETPEEIGKHSTDFPKFIYDYLRPSIGALLFFVVGAITFSSLNDELAGFLSILTAVGGWFTFLAARGLLVPSFKKAKGFDKKTKSHLPIMLLTSLFLTFALLKIPSMFN